MSFRQLKLRRDPDCPVCGERPTVRELIDYEQFCGVGAAAGAAPDEAVDELAPAELERRRAAGDPLVVLDVRNPEEWEICRLDGARLIPLPELDARTVELDPREEVVCVCRTGVRSAKAAAMLRGRGFERVWNLTGGLRAWARDVDPRMPTY
jgi:adenylyltransferase/sulfurtransferase